MKRFFQVLALLLLAAGGAFAQVRTTISDTIYTPLGTPANGTVSILAPVGFTAADGTVVAANSIVPTTVVNGVLSVSLIPNLGSNPVGTYYLATYTLFGSSYSETWIVPVSGSAVKLIAIRAQVIPYLGLSASFNQLNAPPGCQLGQVPEFLNPGWTCISPSGSGTVTSAGLTAPNWFTVGGTPITTSGTFAITMATGQTSHQVIGTCNTATSFGPCPLTLGDIPVAGSPGQVLVNNAGIESATPCLTTANISTGPLAHNCESEFIGPDPYVDVRMYGAVPVNTNVAPSIPGITGTINASSTALTLSSASTFQNGIGIDVFGAGASCSLSTPTSVTVTPVIAAGPTGTGLVVNAPAGSTTYSYQVIATDKLDCYTAASAIVSTTTGPASLGSQSVAITGFTQSGNIVTATTASAHGLVVGADVPITTTNGSDAVYYGGRRIVASTPDNTHFTFQTGMDVADGAPATSISGGTVYWFNGIHIAWTGAPSSDYQYFVYGRASGSMAPVGTTLPNNPAQSITVNTFDDFGPTMMASQVFPYWLPATPPASAFPETLVTTICSGAGTTALTLCNASTNAVSSGMVLLDEAPNIVAAEAATSSFGLLYFPGGNYIVNSHLTTTTHPVINLASGNVVLNATWEVSLARIYGMILSQGLSTDSFGWTTGGTITVSHTSPGLWDVSGNGSLYRGFKVAGTANGQVLHLFDGGGGGAQAHWDYVEYTDGGSNDYMGIPFYARGGFWNDFDHILFATGPGQEGSGFVGSTTTPAAILPAGGLTMKQISVQDRGLFMVPAAAGMEVRFEGQSRAQGIITPFFSESHNGGLGGSIYLSNIDIDTSNQAIFASLGGASAYTVLFRGGTFPCCGYGALTGLPVASNIGGSGQNNSSILGSNFTNLPVSVTGIGEFMVPITNNTAPGTSVSSGGTFATGNYSAVITVVDAIGNESTVSPYSNFTVPSGNQTITVTPPSAPTGAVAWRVYLCAPNGASCTLFTPATCGSPNILFSSTYTNNGGSFTCGNGPPTTSRSAAQSISASGISASQINLTNSGFKDTITLNLTANRAQAVPDLGGTFVLTPWNSYIDISEIAAPANPAGGNERWYANSSTHQLSCLTSGGANCAPTGGGGGGATVTYTTSQTASASDNGKLVLMNCPSACSYTLPAAQPSTTWFANVMSIGSTTATIALGGADTFNGTTSAPVLIKWEVLPVYANTATSTDYEGSAPLVAGTNVTFGPASNGLTITASASGSTSWPSITGSATNTNSAFVLAPTATGTIPWTVTAPSGITVDIEDWNLNATKEVWITSAGVLNTAQVPLFNGNAAMYSTEAAGGDLSGTYPNPTVAQVNGAAVPASAFFLGSNSSHQLIADQPFVVNPQTATYSATAADFAGCKTITVASGTFTITLLASAPASGQCINVFNYGSGVVTIARNGLTINGAAANLTLNAGSASAPTSTNIVSDGSNYFATVDEGTVGTVTSIATTSPITGGTITNTGTIGCATCVTSAASLTSTAIMTGAGGQASQTPNANATLSSGGALTLPGSITLNGATSGSAVLSVTATGGTLNLGSTNATVTSAGGITDTNETDSALTPDAVVYAGAGGLLSGLNSPTVNGFYVVGFNVTSAAAVVPTATLQGVPVNAQSGSYSLLYSDRASYIKESATATLTLPQITGDTASNFPFVTQALSGQTTLTANAADKIDGSATGGSQTVPANFAAFVYQDSSSAPGNWWTIRVPTVASLPSCSGASNALTWNTSTLVFGCNSITGGGGLPSMVGTASNVTAQSSNQSAVTLATAPTAGEYEIQYYADLNTPCTTGSNAVSFTFNWTDATNARSLQTGSLPMGTAQTTTSYLAGNLFIWVGSGNVTYTSAFSGSCASGTASYDVHVSGLMRVQ